jgi:capsule polysaccharide export protein KpsE/RkpR
MREISQLASTRRPEEAAGPAIEEVTTQDFSVIESRDKSIERLRLLWDERRFLGKAVAAGLVLGILLAFLLPKHYQSTVQLMPPDSNDTSGMAMMAAMASGTGSALGALAGDLLGLKNTGAVFVGILRSRTVEDRLVERFSLQKVYRAKLKEDARKELSDNTDVSEDRKSGIITIEVTDKDPQRAAAIAQAYVDELDRLAAEVNTSAAHRERVFLEERLRDVKRALNKAAVDFSQFASKNTTINIEEQGKAMVEAAATLQGQLIAEESELKGLESIYTANNVRVRSVKSRIAELRAQLEKFGGEAGGGTPTTSTSGHSLYPSIRQLPILGVTYFDLYREAKIQEAVYETLTQQYELAKVQEAKETPSVKVLDAAIVPESKSFPPRLLVILLCTSLTLLGGVCWVFAHSRWQRTDSNAPGKILAREVLHSVNAKMPWGTPNGSRLHAMTHKAWISVVRRTNSTKTSNDR